MKIEDGKVAFFHYTLYDEAGEVMESSEGEEPLGYIHGHQNIIPGLEQALDGKAVGDAFKVTVAPGGAYGERDESLVQTLPRGQIEDRGDLEAGMEVRANTSRGTRRATVSQVEGESVTVDMNHPLAGATLVFEVEVTQVREPTAEELEHGHVHGEGGHH